MDLDHVALADRALEPHLRHLVSELGGVYMHGGPSSGFRALQVRLGEPDGMVVELLEPWAVEHNDFLARFLDRHGPGPHHLTFKTDDIRHAIERLEAAGFQPVNTNLSNAWWMETFLMPRQAGGTVVQVAQSGYDEAAMTERMQEMRAQAEQSDRAGEGGWGPPGDAPPRGDRRVRLRRVVLRTPSLDAPLPLFSDLLGGSVDEAGQDWIELAWPAGGRLRFEARPDEPAAVDRLECEHDGPPGEQLVCGTRFTFATT